MAAPFGFPGVAGLTGMAEGLPKPRPGDPSALSAAPRLYIFRSLCYASINSTDLEASPLAKLYYRYGAMGSSKTANAIMVRHNYLERGQRVLMLKPRLDSRDGARIIVSRCGLCSECEFMEDLDQFHVADYDCVIVDEAQFLTKAQVEELVRIVDEENVPVIAYGLRADFRGNFFEGSLWLMAWADTIEEVKTICWCGKKALCNARVVNGQVVKTGEQIVLGGSESYVSLCRRHWTSGTLGEPKHGRMEME